MPSQEAINQGLDLFLQARSQAERQGQKGNYNGQGEDKADRPMAQYPRKQGHNPNKEQSQRPRYGWQGQDNPRQRPAGSPVANQMPVDPRRAQMQQPAGNAAANQAPVDLRQMMIQGAQMRGEMNSGNNEMSSNRFVNNLVAGQGNRPTNNFVPN